MKKLFAIIAILGSISLSSFAQSHSDRITFGVVLALPTNPVFGAVVTTMGIYVSVPVQEATRINSWVASMLATNITMHLGTDGFCIGKPNVT